ncbi:hypothetical protein M419DRAFT_99058 [Trichoderma reesei RUT C-30]|uniref:Ca2+-modulated nonselective cation channel polycystin n=1 Tax=Hypocrea jecorina (strain ATCC 56765 / BCRC 32924 / NRRL 11460 / Rut C-30) TaxID=1344414 RepID=A0A024SCF1_HYPJR|nr:hypothetical protein M419DRAFT_99058 [Trichoderma reesei RUT C-30]
MATTDLIAAPHDGPVQHRRRPFSTWVKKLTNFKSSSDGERQKRHIRIRRGPKLNNPYPQSGHVSQSHPNGQQSSYSFATGRTDCSLSTIDPPTRFSADGYAPQASDGRSLTTTISTETETETDPPRSVIAPSRAPSSVTRTSRTIGEGHESRRGGDSTFSSPSPSVRSLATTLTTIQSLAPHGQAPVAPTHSITQSIQFSQPFPTASPASAIPAHLMPSNHLTTYASATANNLLTDNASILTLASSSKRGRRRSMDTDASVRALAPSSLWGGSRESLPLSVLSANIDPSSIGPTSSLHNASRIGAERNSIYSATGVAPAIPSERNSLYAKQGDGASVRSGRLGHGRPDSISGSVALASPREESQLTSAFKED